MPEKSANLRGKLFVQDGALRDPSQISKLSCNAMAKVGSRLFKIPPKFPDLNPTENTFHNKRKQLKKDVLNKSLEKESCTEICRRIKRDYLVLSIVDPTTKKIHDVINDKGQRIKYYT